MSRESREPPPQSKPSDGQQRLLLFEAGPRCYALPESAIAGLAECGPVCRVPGAPAAVVGLTSWRGHVLMLIDLYRVLRAVPGPGPVCIVRLAPPLERTAFRLQATTLRLLKLRDIAGRPTLVDPAQVIRRVSRKTAEP